MNKGYVSSVLLPEEWDIYGWKLRHFSLRFHLHLTVIESPYLEGQAPNAHDTFLFLKICSNKTDDIFKISKASFIEKLFYARLIYDQRFHAKVFLRIMNYLKENTVNPNTTIRSRIKFDNQMTDEVIKSQNQLPEQLVVTALFANKLHISPNETWNLPISMVAWYASAIALIEGADVSIGPDKEEAQENQKTLAEWEQEQAEKLRLAMVNGKIPRKKIKLSTENGK